MDQLTETAMSKSGKAGRKESGHADGVVRDQVLQIRLSKEEKEMLESLALAEERHVATWVRINIVKLGRQMTGFAAVNKRGG